MEKGTFNKRVSSEGVLIPIGTQEAVQYILDESETRPIYLDAACLNPVLRSIEPLMIKLNIKLEYSENGYPRRPRYIITRV